MIAYANASTGSDSNARTYFFANGTTDGKTPVSAEAAAIFKAAGVPRNMFGVFYGHPAGSAGADAFGLPSVPRPSRTSPPSPAGPLGEPHRRAAALAQCCVVGGRVRRPVMLLRDAVATVSVGLERHGGIPEQR